MTEFPKDHLKMEKQGLQGFIKSYFIVVIALYLVLIVINNLPNIDSSITEVFSIGLWIIFGAPLLLSLGYFFKIISSIFHKDWEAFRFSILVFIGGLIVGWGVCMSNIQIMGGIY
jgi:hypothetical protein